MNDNTNKVNFKHRESNTTNLIKPDPKPYKESEYFRPKNSEAVCSYKTAPKIVEDLFKAIMCNSIKSFEKLLHDYNNNSSDPFLIKA